MAENKDRGIVKRGKRVEARVRAEHLIAETIAEAEALTDSTGLTLDEAVDILVEDGYGLDDPWLLKDWENRHGR